MRRTLIVILAHDNRECLEDMVANVRHFCPSVTAALYNSGDSPDLGTGLDLEVVRPSRRLYYARIAPFFFDLFEWLTVTDVSFDYVVNVDSDLLFIRQGFERFLADCMKGYDYMAPDLRLFIQNRPRWRPIRSLRPELPRWYKFWGFEYAHGAFNPGQTFSRTYIEKLVSHPKYAELLNLVAQNESFTLHEVLFPTLVDFLHLRGRSYPNELRFVNRYRPFQAVTGVKTALSTPTAYFVHPVRREIEDPARAFIREMARRNNVSQDPSSE
jgi:hypothetical protein